MQNNPLVSIMTPCYNSEKWVKRYLDSILSQTYTHIELIIVNDGSTDNTEEIVLSYQNKFDLKGIQLVYKAQENRGLGGAINTALKLINGEYFTWCDSDNFYACDYINTKVKFFNEHPESSIVRCDGYVVNESAIEIPIEKMSKGNKDKFCSKLFINALEEKNFHFGCAMLKTASFDAINPTREIYPSREGQNWQLLLPILYHYNAGYIDKPMFYFVMRQESISNSIAQKGLEEKLSQIEEFSQIIRVTLESMHLDKMEYNRYLAVIYQKYARQKMRLANIYRETALLTEQYRYLKIHRWATWSDVLIYGFGRYPAGRAVYKVYRSLQHVLMNGKTALSHCIRQITSAKQFEIDQKSTKGNNVSVLDKTKCAGCYACYSICPKKCIDMTTDDEGFIYPRVSAEQCLNCGLCKMACPVISGKKGNAAMDSYAAYHKDDLIRKKSSSGGIFTPMAKKLLSNQGVVFGAKFDNKWNVVHDYIETEDGLEQLQGSKYVHSQMEDMYSKAKIFLEQGRRVLFSGTPCQTAGLKQYLKKEYENLLCIDFICHGVTSPAVWQSYLNYRSEYAHSPICSVSFRDKSQGWENFSIKILFQNKTVYQCPQQQDLMMQAYLSNLCLRPSCHQCSFKNCNSQSDITLADFWGIEHIFPDIDTENGVSLILIHTNKGQDLFESVKPELLYRMVNSHQALQYNSAVFQSVKPHKNRNSFYKNLYRYNFEKLVSKYGCSMRTKIKRHILNLRKYVHLFRQA